MYKTKPTQLKASRAYQKRNASFTLWYDKKVREDLVNILKAHGMTPKEVFEMGLERLGHTVPKVNRWSRVRYLMPQEHSKPLS